jgi:hypothetical protein
VVTASTYKVYLQSGIDGTLTLVKTATTNIPAATLLMTLGIAATSFGTSASRNFYFSNWHKMIGG